MQPARTTNGTQSLLAGLLLALVFCAVLVLAICSPAMADDQTPARGRVGVETTPLSLVQADRPRTDTTALMAEQTRTTTVETLSSGWTISGPISLRSADPEEPRELEIKNIFGWSTSKDGTDDDAEYELEIEYGLIENHELIFEVPVEMGDGRVNGNADITLGWHWRLWKEQDWLPAFAMRNYLRLPTGVDSSGVDWTWKGLFTKTILPDKLRLHFNPFFTSVNGDNEEEARHFLWGGAIGMDYRLTESLLFIWDYKYETGEIEHTRDQHALELGVDWTIVEHHKIGLATEIGLDGDSQGPSLATKVSYIISF